MSKLTVLTFADKPLAESNYLKKSCKDLGLHLEVLIQSPWTVNAIKIKLLYEYLIDVDPDKMILAVDAFDVAIYDAEEVILKKFEGIEGDIVFSAESNFYFRNKKLVREYWKRYPRNGTIYDYLNSGTYMGKASDLLTMLKGMLASGDVVLEENELIQLRSDQYAFSKHYVDSFSSKEGPIIRLDHNQRLMGCTGGRFSVKKFKDLSKMQAFLFFLIERNILKAFKLHPYQTESKDYMIKNGRFYNALTGQFPSVIHLPGTWENFETVIKRFLNRSKGIDTNAPKSFMASFISNLSYPLSIVLALFLRFPKINRI